MAVDPKLRFSSRVQNYVRYRPSYPLPVVKLLQRECGLREGTQVADVGSGTGIFTKLLLDAGAVVMAIEPNREMREAAESMLAQNPRFQSLAGSAESTGLAEASVDLVTSAQAFHWFQSEAATAEFHRILRPGGWIVLVWNERLVDSSPFLKDYERLLRTHSPEYLELNHREFDESRLQEVFEPNPMQVASFPNEQRLDYEGLEGRVLSSSYSPEKGHPAHDPMVTELRRIFDAHQKDGTVAFRYETKVYYGRG
jgi:SAM-dependent methyltransferase